MRLDHLSVMTVLLSEVHLLQLHNEKTCGDSYGELLFC